MLTNPKCDDGLICNETIEAIKNYYKSMNLLNTDVFYLLKLFIK